MNIEIGGPDEAAGLLRHSKVYQGGNWNHLHRLLSLTSGAYLLYVGDHMYSDILRSKRTLGWRTLLIVPEIADELNDAAAARDATEQVGPLRLCRPVGPCRRTSIRA